MPISKPVVFVAPLVGAAALCWFLAPQSSLTASAAPAAPGIPSPAASPAPAPAVTAPSPTSRSASNSTLQTPDFRLRGGTKPIPAQPQVSVDMGRVYRLQTAMRRFQESQQLIEPMPGASPNPALTALLEQLAENQILLTQQLNR